MIINQDLNYVFISMPKCGTIAMFDILQKYYQGIRIHPENQHWKKIPEEYKNAFKFSTCRCPYSRAIASWVYAIRVKDKTVNPRLSILQHYQKIQKNLFASPLWARQSDWLNNISIDMYLKSENLIQELSRLPFYNGMPQSHPPMNSFKHNRRDYRTYLTKDLIHLIEKRYGPDFEKFDYKIGEFPDEPIK